MQFPPEKLRWAVGCIVAEDDEQEDEELVAKLVENGYKKFSTPHVSDAVCTSFPRKTWLSIYIAVMRVYDAIAKYMNVGKIC